MIFETARFFGIYERKGSGTATDIEHFTMNADANKSAKSGASSLLDRLRSRPYASAISNINHLIAS
jgi:hypothetical protein